MKRLLISRIKALGKLEGINTVDIYAESESLINTICIVNFKVVIDSKLLSLLFSIGTIICIVLI